MKAIVRKIIGEIGIGSVKSNVSGSWTQEQLQNMMIKRQGSLLRVDSLSSPPYNSDACTKYGP
jgi:hypothetical protein